MSTVNKCSEKGFLMRIDSDVNWRGSGETICQ